MKFEKFARRFSSIILLSTCFHFTTVLSSWLLQLFMQPCPDFRLDFWSFWRRGSVAFQPFQLTVLHLPADSWQTGQFKGRNVDMSFCLLSSEVKTRSLLSS